MRAPELEPATRFHPRLLFRFGAAMTIGGSLLAGRLFDSELAIVTPITVAVLGVGLMIHTARVLAQRHRIDVEVADAIDRRGELSLELARLVEKGGKVTRYLESAGFTQPLVRRWIAAQFVESRPRVVLAPRPGPAAQPATEQAEPNRHTAPRSSSQSAFSRAGPPSFQQALLDLDPRAKIAAGAMLLAVALGTFRPIQGAFVAGYLNIAIAVLGLGALLIGIGEYRHKTRVEREIAAALERRAELERALADLAASDGNVSRYLQQEGFRDYGVRRWIATEFGPPPDTAADDQSERRRT